MAIAAWCANPAARVALRIGSRAHVAPQLSAASRAWKICKQPQSCSRRAWAAAERYRSPRCCRARDRHLLVRPHRCPRARSLRRRRLPPRSGARANLGRGKPLRRCARAPKNPRYGCVRPARRGQRASARPRSPSLGAHRRTRRAERVSSLLRAAVPGLCLVDRAKRYRRR